MAKMTVDIDDSMFEPLIRASEGACKAAVYEGQKLMTDALKANIAKLPSDHGKGAFPFHVVNGQLRRELAEACRPSVITEEKDGWEGKVTFHGYSGITTAKYSRGIPLPMIARAIESGSSMRRKEPFIRRTVNQNKAAAEAAMTAKANEILSKAR